MDVLRRGLSFDDCVRYVEVSGDRIYLEVAEYESDIWVMDLAWLSKGVFVPLKSMRSAERSVSIKMVTVKAQVVSE